MQGIEYRARKQNAEVVIINNQNRGKNNKIFLLKKVHSFNQYDVFHVYTGLKKVANTW
jgi:hypothetical protein